MLEPQNFIPGSGSNSNQGNALIMVAHSGKDAAHPLVKICMQNLSSVIFFLIFKIKVKSLHRAVL